MSLIDANGTTIYYELRGRGPALLFVSGATGDAGHWTGVADALASQHTVITYDRRGNSRSPRPAGWTTTTIDEQADDAAELLEGLDAVPTIVLGTSAAAGIVASLAVRHPAVLRGVIFHEPLFPSGVTNADAVRAGRRELIDEGMARGGPRGGTELFLRSVAGDDVYESLDPGLRAEPSRRAPTTAAAMPLATGDTNRRDGSPPSSTRTWSSCRAPTWATSAIQGCSQRRSDPS
jgi:pimeloyl-ACP methyl ester carboxylesterase